MCSTVQNNTVQRNTKKIIWTWTFEAWFHTYSLLMVNENVYFHAGIAGDRLLICYETSSQSCWKMWNWRLGFVCSYAWWCSTTYSSCILGIFEHVSGTMKGMRWTTSMDCLSTCLSPLNFYLWAHLKSTVYTKEASGDYCLQQWSRVDLRWFLWHLEFFSTQAVTVHTCSLLHWGLRWTLLIIFFNLQEAITQKPSFRRPIFTELFFSYCVVGSPFVGMAVHFSFIWYIRRI
jgi:hypothetical protein